MTKQDILDYLNNLRKPISEDPTHRWVGSYNGRQMIFNKFFRWLYNPDADFFLRRDGSQIVAVESLNGTDYNSADSKTHDNAGNAINID
jgi:hypothetical protein